MKQSGDYHPPQGWVKVGTLNPGDKFHDIGPDGQPIQYVKLELVIPVSGPLPKFNAVSLHDGKQRAIDPDEYVFPIDAGWVAELRCYGFKFSEELLAQGHRAILAYVMARTESRKEHNAWRAELTKYCPSLAIMSFAGHKRIVSWVMEQLGIKEDHDDNPGSGEAG